MNGTEETLVRGMLHRATADLSPGELTPDRLVAVGERAVRRRRRRTVGSAAVTVLALLGVTVLLGVGPAGSPADRVGPPTASPTPGWPTEAPTSFAPERRVLRLGWQPDGLTDEGFSGRRSGQEIYLASGTGPAARQVVVKVGARGNEDLLNLLLGQRESSRESGQAIGVPTDPVRGHDAWMYTSPSGYDVSLSWQYAPDGWVVVSARDAERPAEVARRVAEELRWESTPVTVPLAPIPAPPGAQLRGVSVDFRSGRWNGVHLNYAAGATDDDGFSVAVRRDRLGRRGTATTEAGRSAWVVNLSDHSIGVYQVGELSAACSPCYAEAVVSSPGGLAVLGGRAAALRFAASVRLVDDPDDRKGWRPL
ncbi:hypothetical protein V6U81_06030 [Micromonospora sp. CPCC 205711]|uniref:hypothetical protein n=1 Tax=Micromonospora sp. CPCC 205547 TaxID=3122400 RepID=UPI002FF357B4